MSMLSPGTHFKHVPTDPRDNLLWRLEFSRAVNRRGDRYKRLVRRMCAEDLIFYVNAYVFTHNPLVTPSVVPFVLWDYQTDVLRETIKYLFKLERSVIWEKSRYQGASWMALALFDWAAMFHRWKKFLAVSHKEEAVDRRDDMDSLFEKVRFMHKYVPHWLSGGPASGKLRFKYPNTHSGFTGASTSKRTAVGGRATAILLDEFGKQENDFEIFGQTADTGPRLIISTHYGRGTAFYKYTRPGAGIHKIVMHWTQHPVRGKGLYKFDPNHPDARPDGIVLLDDYPHPPDYPFDRTKKPLGGYRPGVRSPWYDAAVKERSNERDTAQHLDINPDGASAQFFDVPTIVRLKEQVCSDPLWRGELIWDRVTGRPEKLVQTENGPLKLWVIPDAYGRIRPGAYGAGSDISFGEGVTPSTIAIGDALSDPARMVAMYADAYIGTEDFASFCAALCRIFPTPTGQGALLCWESAGPSGGKFGKEMVNQIRYENSWVYEDDEIHRKVKVIRERKYGYPAAPKQKNMVLKDLRDGIASGKLIVPCAETLEESLAYVFNERGDKIFHGASENTDDPRGGTVNHGDRIVAAALMWKMLLRLGAKDKPEQKQERQGYAYMTQGWMLEQADKLRRDRLENYGREAYLRRR